MDKRRDSSDLSEGEDNGNKANQAQRGPKKIQRSTQVVIG